MCQRYHGMNTTVTRFSSIPFLLLACIICRDVAADDLKVGAAAVNLVADDSMVIAGGILPKFAVGQEGELRVVAVVIEKPRTAKLAIVACDVLFMTRDIADAAVAAIEKSTGIPSHRTCSSMRRTHTMPPARQWCMDTGERNNSASDCRQAIVLAVQQANSKLADGESAFLLSPG